MISAVDTNVLLDILIPNTAHLESSLNCLLNTAPGDTLIICEAVYAELGSQFLSSQDLDTFLSDTAIEMVNSNERSLFEASNAWKRYSKRKQSMIVCPACGNQQKTVCDSCGKAIPYRQHILADFLIGAHANIQAERLITRDRGFYRTYFDHLDVLTP